MYRNKLTHLKNGAKKLYYQDIFRKNKQNTAKLWKTINNILNVSKQRGNNIPDKMTTGKKDYAYGNQCVSNMSKIISPMLVLIWQLKFLNQCNAIST